MVEEPQYVVSLTFDEIALIKEVFDYEIEDDHELLAKGYLDDSEREECRAYIKSLIALNRKLDTIEKKLTPPILKEELTEPLNPEFLEID